MRGFWSAVSAVVVAVALAGCVPEPTVDAWPTATSTAAPEVTFESVIDGDTIETSGGTVRIIGIDAPERGECGYEEAGAVVSSLLRAGDPIVLELPEGQNAEDKYGRILRYVDTVQGVDVASVLLAAGLAVARYDSADGYPAHPRESDYRAAQLATVAEDGSVTTTACAAAAEQADAEAAAAEQARLAAEQQAAAAPVAPPTEEWWRQYTSCTKLKKNTNGHPTGPFARDNPAEAAIYDWFANGTGNNGDGEGDGLACE